MGRRRAGKERLRDYRGGRSLLWYRARGSQAFGRGKWVGPRQILRTVTIGGDEMQKLRSEARFFIHADIERFVISQAGE